MMKRNRLILPLGALLALLALGAVVVLVRASADDLLHQSARLLAETQRGHAILDVQLNTPDKSASGTFEVWGQRNAGPEGEPAFHVKVLNASEADAVGVEAISDGEQVWIVNPNKNTVYVGTREELKAKMAAYKAEHDYDGIDRPTFNEEEWPETPEEAVDNILLKYFKAERAGSANIGLETADELHLIPDPEQMPEEVLANGGLLKVFLRASDKAFIAAEYTGAVVGDGKVTVSSLELDGELPDGIFTYDIPAGWEVVNLADYELPQSLTMEEASAVSDVPVLSPAYLPAEARLEEITEVRGAIVQRYRLRDGEHLTIAQGPASAAEAPADGKGEPVLVRGVEGLLFSDEDGARTLLTWPEGEATVWVGGYLPAAEALAIAESLR